MNLVADALIRLHPNGYMPQHGVQVQALLSESMPPPPSVPLHELHAKKTLQVSKEAQQLTLQVSKEAQQFDKESNAEWLNRPNMLLGSSKQSTSFSGKQKEENKRTTTETKKEIEEQNLADFCKKDGRDYASLLNMM